MSVLVVLILGLLFYESSCQDCLHYRSVCLRNHTCHFYLQNFQSRCGLDLSTCTGRSPSDCTFILQQLRSLLPASSCSCHPTSLGMFEECDYFRQLLWNHPCERLMDDLRRESATPRRTTRNPVTDQVKELKTKFSNELVTKASLKLRTCDEALNAVCLRHVSCSQLWRLFRSSCDVDNDNQCRMADREVCWQSFEGLTWTGLGDCRCDDSNNSDCHWIRLHTNYNKCIYEMSKSGQYPQLTSWIAQRNYTMQRYQQRYENMRNEYSVKPTSRAPTTPAPTTRIFATAAPTTRIFATAAPTTRIFVTPAPTNRPFLTPAPTFQSVIHQDNYRSYQNDNGAAQRRPAQAARTRPPATWAPAAAPRMTAAAPPTTYRPSTNTGSYRKETTIRFKVRLEPDQYNGPRRNSSGAFRPRSTSRRSSCQDAFRRCEALEECRWHLGELKVRCSTGTCRKQECADSLQRFSTYVPFSLVESIMFCHCANGDQQCLELQELLYPKCLYRSTNGGVSSCTTLAHKCDADTRCRYLRRAIQAHCPVENGQCSRVSLDDCRRTVLQARASILEQPCFCPLSDMNCLAQQNVMIPDNPCIENAMIEYSKIMGYSVERDVSLETNRIGSSSTGKKSEEIVKEHVAPRNLERTTTKSPITSAPIRRQKIRTTPAPAPPSTRAPRVTTSTTPAPTTTKKAGFFDFIWRKDTTTTTTTTTMIPDLEIYESEEEGVGSDEEEDDDLTKETVGVAGAAVASVLLDKRKKLFRTTKSPPTTREPPPWELTTTGMPTTTTVFMTHAPPPPDGCTFKDPNGKKVFTHEGSLVRKFLDWSGRCSSWCECKEDLELVCEKLPCLEEGICANREASLAFGERLYIEGRGACYCEAARFICETPDTMPEFYPGLYLAIGFSTRDVEMMRNNVPTDILDRAGFLSTDVATDIASRLQIQFERILPTDLRCRIVTMPELAEPENAFYRVEWYGMNQLLNQTKVDWYSGGAEKICSPYVRLLADHFTLNEGPRFQLVLSTVKQVKVLDYLDGLPQSTSHRLCCSTSILALLLAFLCGF